VAEVRKFCKLDEAGESLVRRRHRAVHEPVEPVRAGVSPGPFDPGPLRSTGAGELRARLKLAWTLRKSHRAGDCGFGRE
jgi:hypothetical protein